jgi:hypothetical protein
MQTREEKKKSILTISDTRTREPLEGSVYIIVLLVSATAKIPCESEKNAGQI